MSFSGEGEMSLLMNKFSGAALKIAVDGENTGLIAYPPYRLPLNIISEGTHRLDITLLGTRMNTFGNIHATDEKIRFIGPDSYDTSGDMWSDEYILRRNGILRAPELLK